MQWVDFLLTDRGDRDRGDDVNLFPKGQIIGMHQVKRTSKEIAEATKNGLRRIGDNREPSSLRSEKCGQKKNLEWSGSVIT